MRLKSKSGTSEEKRKAIQSFGEYVSSGKAKFFSDLAIKVALSKTEQWIGRAKAADVRNKENWVFRNYWKKQNSLIP